MTRRLLIATLLALTAILPLVAAAVPRPSPEFVIKGAGSQTLLSQYKGKVVLLMFMFTTCPHCQVSTQMLSGIQKEYAARGVQVLGVAFNEGAPLLVAEFNRRFQPTFPVGSAPRDAVLDYLKHAPQDPFSVPMFLFIDKQGVIRAQHEGGAAFFAEQEKNTRAQLDSMLGAPKKTAKR